jgi:16S rRNA processing protein RimM
MAYKRNILLGRISKVSGHEGAVSVRLEKIFSENLPYMESVFLEIDGRLVPFIISYSEYSGAAILKLKFEGYDTIEKVQEFSGCRIFLTSNMSTDEKAHNIKNLKGYKVFIQNNELLGSVSEVIHYPGQLLLNIITSENKKILIPFHEHFIVRIDSKRKIIVMDIPEGLTDLNGNKS